MQAVLAVQQICKVQENKLTVWHYKVCIQAYARFNCIKSVILTGTNTIRFRVSFITNKRAMHRYGYSPGNLNTKDSKRRTTKCFCAGNKLPPLGEALEPRGEATTNMEWLPIYGILRTCAFAGVNFVDRHSFFWTLNFKGTRRQWTISMILYLFASLIHTEINKWTFFITS